jgi:D-3-phosphoglycerate dehydrogenase
VDALIIESDGFSSDAINILCAGGVVSHCYDGALSDVGDVIDQYDGVIVRLGVQWSSALLAKAPSLKFIATLTTGLNHIDLAAAAAQGIEVISLRALQGMDKITSTPEHALALLLALVRNVVPAVESTRRGEWNRDTYTGSMLNGKAIGIIGLGRTGRQMARYVQALGMRVHYFDPHVDEPAYVRCARLEDLAAACHVISLHAILSPDTHGLLGSTFFENCRSNAVFVNTARGELVDEKALLVALKEGRLSGAALDVLQNEPVTGQALTSALQRYAAEHDHLIISPHIAGCTREAMRRTEELLANAVVARLGSVGGG